MPPDQEQRNYEIFRDCLGETVIQKLSAPQKAPRRRGAKARKNSKGRRSGAGNGYTKSKKFDHTAPEENTKSDPEALTTDGGMNDAEDLADFLEVLLSNRFRKIAPY